MPAPLLALMLAVTQPEMAIAVSPDSPSEIADAHRDYVKATLERIGNDPPLYRLHLLNRNEFPVRVDYRLMSKDGDVGSVTSAILRNLNPSTWKNPNDNSWNALLIVLPTGIDYTDIRIYDVVPGKVHDRIGSRVSSTGTIETYTEMEFVPCPPPDVIPRTARTDGTVHHVCPRKSVIEQSEQIELPTKPRPPTAHEIRERSMGRRR